MARQSKPAIREAKPEQPSALEVSEIFERAKTHLGIAMRAREMALMRVARGFQPLKGKEGEPIVDKYGNKCFELDAEGAIRAMSAIDRATQTSAQLMTAYEARAQTHEYTQGKDPAIYRASLVAMLDVIDAQDAEWEQ